MADATLNDLLSVSLVYALSVAFFIPFFCSKKSSRRKKKNSLKNLRNTPSTVSPRNPPVDWPLAVHVNKSTRTIRRQHPATRHPLYTSVPGRDDEAMERHAMRLDYMEDDMRNVDEEGIPGKVEVYSAKDAEDEDSYETLETDALEEDDDVPAQNDDKKIAPHQGEPAASVYVGEEEHDYNVLKTMILGVPEVKPGSENVPLSSKSFPQNDNRKQEDTALDENRGYFPIYELVDQNGNKKDDTYDAQNEGPPSLTAEELSWNAHVQRKPAANEVRSVHLWQGWETRMPEKGEVRKLPVKVMVCPRETCIPNIGGFSLHYVFNPTSHCLAVKLKVTNAQNYVLIPPFAIVKPKSMVPIGITRAGGTPKKDRVSVVYVEVSPEEGDPFKACDFAAALETHDRDILVDC